MKRTIISIILVFFAAICSFAQEKKLGSQIVTNENGDCCFETSFLELLNCGVNSEIWVQNNSAYAVNNLLCTVFINDKNHSLRGIQTIPPGDDREFEGYDDDEMKDEFPCFFGSDGAFKKRNTNKITFVISFRPRQKNVEITKVINKGKSLVFVIENSEEGDKLLKSDLTPKDDGAKKVVINGKTYILSGEKYIPVEE